MIRIGILGSDNSHALAFAKLCNLPMENGEYRYPDVRIAAIYGNDDDPQPGTPEHLPQAFDMFFR